MDPKNILPFLRTASLLGWGASLGAGVALLTFTAGGFPRQANAYLVTLAGGLCGLGVHLFLRSVVAHIASSCAAVIDRFGGLVATPTADSRDGRPERVKKMNRTPIPGSAARARRPAGRSRTAGSAG